jgi:deoxycytidine triphosphate deaminase
MIQDKEICGSCLSRDDIKKELLLGNIKIYPFCKELLKEASYDVRLGDQCYVQDGYFGQKCNIWTQKLDHKIYPTFQSSLDMWKGPKEFNKEVITVRGNVDNRKVFWLKPKEMILGHTYDFVGTSNQIAMFMGTRSSVARSLLFTCNCSFFGNPGFFDRWTLEITNNSYMYEIPVISGECLSSVVFIKTSSYQTTKDIEIPSDHELEKILNNEEFVNQNYLKTIKSWDPKKMLSKLSNPI